ncbi:tetratricopeptide repeat protein [Thiotrichales bacterium 19S11-10]|nr:tetratricopeptide repeat protein [Thiotrichales bacterium 19S11-10]
MSNLNDAFSLYQKKQYGEAERICKLILEQNDHDFNAICLLGGISLQQNKLKDAVEYFSKAIQLNPNHHESYNSLGIVLAKSDQIDQAVINYQKAIQINPNFHQAYYNLAIALQKQNKLQDAVINYQKAIQLSPNFYDAYLNLAILFAKQKKIEQAITNYKEAIRLNPNHEKTYYELGRLLAEINQLDQAVLCFKKTVELNPSHYKAYSDLGLALYNQNQFDKAMLNYQKAIQVNPNDYNIYNNLGALFGKQNQFDQAISSYKKAIQINPQCYEAYNNLANIYRSQKKFTQAIDHYEKAIQLNANYHDAYRNMGLIQLYNFDFKNGWKNYQYRLKTEKTFYIPPEAEKIYQGQNLKDKTLCLYHEQGIGDAIMTARFIHSFIQMHAEIILYIPINLYHLLKESFPDVKVITEEPSQKDYDYHLPLMSIPMMLNINNTNVPFTNGYFSVNHDKVKAYKTENFNSNKKNIGIVWKGNPKHTNDRNRSLDLKTLLTKIDQKDNQQYYSLQVGISENEKQQLTENNIFDLGTGFTNFYDTAIAISCLDALVCVDTAIAHLGGALSIPTYIILPEFGIDWRWGHQGERSYWYDSVRLIRDNTVINLL